MKKKEINLSEIEKLIPHRKPLLLIDSLVNIVPMISATGIMNIKKSDFFFQGHFPDQAVMPGVLIVEAFGQTAAALTAYSVDPEIVKNKLVYLMTVKEAKFRKPVFPPNKLELKVKAVKALGKVWKYEGTAMIKNDVMAEAVWMATIVDKNDS